MKAARIGDARWRIAGATGRRWTLMIHAARANDLFPACI